MRGQNEDLKRRLRNLASEYSGICTFDSVGAFAVFAPEVVFVITFDFPGKSATIFKRKT